MTKKLFRDERGNVLIITAIALPILLAAFGLGFETAQWYQLRRQMQNAADSATIAAATNGGTNYADEARAVAAQYGFQNGVNNTTVTVSNTAACPAGGNNCYRVSIQQNVKLILAQLIGFTGDATIGSSYAKQILSSAVGSQDTQPRNYCLLALASTAPKKNAIQVNGGPKADLGGCNIMSNQNADCNGHDLKAGYADAVGTSTGCGTVQNSNMPAVTDPYSSLASNIPANTCTSYSVTGNLSGSMTWSGSKSLCGNQQLTNDVTLSTNAGTLVIWNGGLDLNGHTIKTASGSSVTLIFAGDTNGTYSHVPSGKKKGSIIDIQAPTTGAWSGVAMYQAPNLTKGVDISDAGNSPAWNISGLAYLPHSSVTFSGVVGKSSNGASCFTMVVNDITINGTGKMLDQSECTQAGLTKMPQGQVPGGRGKLVS